MTQSMTGFTAQEGMVENSSIMLELRAVNSRYLDLHFKIDDEFRVLEPQIRELIKAKVSRGKIECKLKFSKQSFDLSSVDINNQALDHLVVLGDKVQKALPNSQPLSVSEVLAWPNVLNKPTVNQNQVNAEVINLVNKALSDLNDSRAREGEKLKTIILERLQAVEALVETIKPKMAGIVQAHQTKLTQKLTETIQTLDEERITQELVLFAQRIDVDEELTRLTAHISEVKHTLGQNKPAGKRLDFMMQEMNREANTLGSKSVAIETTQASMSLKVLIEQMREQIQNIE